MSPENTVLVYPTNDQSDSPDITPHSITEIENFLIIDGTWQEANKIYNRSPYLKRFQKFSLPENLQSEYKLRKNQKSSGLSTVESAIKILILKAYNKESELLHERFTEFQDSYYKRELP